MWHEQHGVKLIAPFDARSTKYVYCYYHDPDQDNKILHKRGVMGSHALKGSQWIHTQEVIYKADDDVVAIDYIHDNQCTLFVVVVVSWEGVEQGRGDMVHVLKIIKTMMARLLLLLEDAFMLQWWFTSKGTFDKRIFAASKKTSWFERTK